MVLILSHRYRLQSKILYVRQKARPCWEGNHEGRMVEGSIWNLVHVCKASVRLFMRACCCVGVRVLGCACDCGVCVCARARGCACLCKLLLDGGWVGVRQRVGKGGRESGRLNYATSVHSCLCASAFLGACVRAPPWPIMSLSCFV